MSSDPYGLWRAGHRGIRRNRRKRIHRWRIGAWWHLFRLRWSYGSDRHSMDVYPCQWADDYRLHRWGWSAPRHWHVGRSNKWGHR